MLMLPAVEFIKTVLCPDRLGIEPLQLLPSFFAHRGEGLTLHLQLSPLLLPACEVVGEEALVVAPLLMGAAPLRHVRIDLWPLW